jgi:hypothetical protein
MALSAFADKSSPPQAVELEATLGSAFAAWNLLRDLIADRFAPVSEEWGFTSRTTGWGLRLKREKRVILYLTPGEGHFLASFALGEKAVTAARASDLPGPVLEVIDRAPQYAEGRGVRLKVQNAQDVQNVAALAAIKMAG